MTVQKLPSPRLITDSMAGGGTVHQSFGMSAPGSMPIDGLPQGFEVEPLADVMMPPAPGNDRNLLGPDGSPRDPQDASFPVRDPDSGRYTGTGADPWKSAGSEAGGWHQV
jgi:hypothetical protein